ncbi:mitochondrial ribonuclease P protein 1 homolog isoform X2 [Gordionus sp. m RMFG-2023]|uniref:mitochondrial ribonuclease P protein 1 homolog isoform X2 n=1 Tax=Gordionus sp. m RMFG-2023 TaxID=3053472 RepID=UPI0031FE0829
MKKLNFLIRNISNNSFIICANISKKYFSSSKLINFNQQNIKETNLKIIRNSHITQTKMFSMENGSKHDNELEYIDKEKKLAILKMEYELLKFDMSSRINTSDNPDTFIPDEETHNNSSTSHSYSVHKVPSVVTDIQWENLLNLPSKQQRVKYYRYLFKNEMSTANYKAKKDKQVKKRYEIRKSVLDEQAGHILYGLKENSMFFYIREAKMKNFFAHRLALNKVIGEPNLVLDMEFDKHMNLYEKGETANQIREMHHLNRSNKQPFNILFCNCHKMNPNQNSNGQISTKSESLLDIIQKRMVDIENAFIEATDKSYLDLFPHENLIYLSPNAPNYMEVYDPFATYVIGALVEKSSSKPYSLAKAKREKVKTWGLGKKDLPLNHVMGILLDIKNTGDWNVALKHIPRRKLYNYQDNTDIQDKRFKNILKF